MGNEELARALHQQGISDERVLEAIRRLERADFVPELVKEAAGQDSPLPIAPPTAMPWSPQLLWRA